MIVPDVTTTERDAAVAAYEALRGHVLAGPAAGNAVGLVLLLREGVVAWVARGRARVASAEPAAEPARRIAAPVVSDELHAGLVRVLASMALAGRAETSA